MTTIKVPVPLRDRVAALASEYGEGVSLSEALRRVIEEHEENQIIAGFEELRRDPVAWAQERAESAMTDNAASDWLHAEGSPE